MAQLMLLGMQRNTRVEASLLGGSELGGNDKVGKAHQCLADVLETFFELGGVG